MKVAPLLRLAATRRGDGGSDVCTDTTPATGKTDFSSACSSLAACKADDG